MRKKLFITLSLFLLYNLEYSQTNPYFKTYAGTEINNTSHDSFSLRENRNPYIGIMDYFAQNIDSLFSKQKLQNKFAVQIQKDSSSIGSFPTKSVAIITFKWNGASVNYFAFKYKTSDSIAFENAENKYWAVSGCNIVPHKDFDKNFGSFIYDKYFFLLEHCSCRTGENEICAELASRINHWRKEK